MVLTKENDMLVRANTSSGVGGGNDCDVFTLDTALAANGTVQFNVKSSTYQVLGFRGDSTDGLKAVYVAGGSLDGLYAYNRSGSGASAVVAPTAMFSFSGNTVTFTNTTGNTLAVGTVIFIIY